MAMEYEELAKDLEDVRGPSGGAWRGAARYRRTALGKRRMREQAQRLRWRRRQQEFAARELRRCEVCDGPVPLTARLSRRTCSGRCRQKLSRRLAARRQRRVCGDEMRFR